MMPNRPNNNVSNNISNVMPMLVTWTVVPQGWRVLVATRVDSMDPTDRYALNQSVIEPVSHSVRAHPHLLQLGCLIIKATRQKRAQTCFHTAVLSRACQNSWTSYNMLFL